MNHVVIAGALKYLIEEKKTFLDRADISVLTTTTNDETLKIHQENKSDLIITQLDMPGMQSEELFKAIRENDKLKQVSIILVCRDTHDHRERSKNCGANIVFFMPVDPVLLHIKAQQLLSIAPRKAHRAVLAIAIQGAFKNKPLPFWTENISASGMLIKAEEPLAVGDRIFFSFFLPDGTHASGYGEIARVIVPQVNSHDVFRYGIKFTNVSPSVKLSIDAIARKY
jgi:CheY-like chemotaxis protein